MLARERNYIIKWENHQSKGKWAYMVLTSLVWGTLLPLFFFLFKLAWHGDLNFSGIRETLRNSHYVFVWAFCAGFVFLKSFLLWHLAKNKYLSLKRKQEQELIERQLSPPVD